MHVRLYTTQFHYYRYKRRHSAQNKYPFTKGNLATSIPRGPADKERDSGKAEEIEIASVAPTEEGAAEMQEDVTLEETDDYFQDPTAISKHHNCVLILLTLRNTYMETKCIFLFISARY